jgi:DNA (cytosine-5)-methyltransferase 3A
MVNKDKKAYVLTASYGKAVEKHSVEKKQRTMVKMGHIIRKLTPIECERLQSLPDNYTDGIAMTNRYKCLGNAFNVEVIAHILKSI